ncbi:hypothetical protein P8452_77521 [Trifolium repens]|nr:hypothetical protein P8452_77521 [Trifolium repens]
MDGIENCSNLLSSRLRSSISIFTLKSQIATLHTHTHTPQIPNRFQFSNLTIFTKIRNTKKRNSARKSSKV